MGLERVRRWACAGFLVTLLAACPQPDETPDTGLTGYDPGLVDRERAACTERGGRFAPGGGTGRFVCFETTRDAGKRCSAETDCESVCLARSRSCAPLTPFFGCHEVLTASGRPATICID